MDEQQYLRILAIHRIASVFALQMLSALLALDRAQKHTVNCADCENDPCNVFNDMIVDADKQAEEVLQAIRASLPDSCDLDNYSIS